MSFIDKNTRKKYFTENMDEHFFDINFNFDLIISYTSQFFLYFIKLFIILVIESTGKIKKIFYLNKKLLF